MVAVPQVDQDLEQKLQVPTSMRGETPRPMHTDKYTSRIYLKIVVLHDCRGFSKWAFLLEAITGRRELRTCTSKTIPVDFRIRNLPHVLHRMG